MFEELLLQFIILLIGGLFVRNCIPSEGDMFSYSGAIIGGGITLIGVIFNIRKAKYST